MSKNYHYVPPDTGLSAACTASRGRYPAPPSTSPSRSGPTAVPNISPPTDAGGGRDRWAAPGKRWARSSAGRPPGRRGSSSLCRRGWRSLESDVQAKKKEKIYQKLRFSCIYLCSNPQETYKLEFSSSMYKNMMKFRKRKQKNKKCKEEQNKQNFIK